VITDEGGEEDIISPSLVESVDRARVHEVYDSWPRVAAEKIGRSIEIAGDFERVAFLGVGGSAAAGDIISDWLAASGRMAVEFSVFKGTMPKARLEKALVIVCSASGNTEETLGLAERALKSGARKMVTISSGGKLRQLSETSHLDHLDVEVPLAPRYSLPGMLFSTLAVLRGARLLDDGVEPELEDAVASMRRIGARIGVSVPSGKNPAKKLAISISDSFPKIYGSSVTRGVATRFKNSLNENAKMHASAEHSPELFHNEVEAWEAAAGERGRFVPIFVRHREEPPREAARIEAFADLLKRRGSAVEVVWGEESAGSTTPMCLGGLVGLCYMLDYASYYAAILRRADPYPIDLIEQLKKVT
jgi:glucose/mannose-6-phosphate isomerase